MAGFKTNIEEKTVANVNFRQVLFTGKYSQIVVMSLRPGEEIGVEVHETVDQFFRFEKGQGKVVIDGEEFIVADGDAVVVPAGSKHNIINTSAIEELKLYTIYSPPNHPDGTIHATLEEAMAAEEAEHHYQPAVSAVQPEPSAMMPKAPVVEEPLLPAPEEVDSEVAAGPASDPGYGSADPVSTDDSELESEPADDAEE